MAGTVGTTSDTRCPCGSGDRYDACCGRFHRGAADAPTAEALMRSRYSAFALRDTAYLARTWHASTRPGPDELRLDEQQRWLRLDVVETAGGGPFDDQGTVLFEARWRSGAERGVLRERSRFVREQRRWTYLDGELA
ncbi:YchJ family protein [Streptomyces sp. NP160]|uniref:YchJ family protein n=1 Tax=Streptomyces sp. NP160 TaxID=2586637 RepID=UPI0015D5D5BC|nr:YchJ family protein [Streptomyces sp. NP160]